MATRKMMVVVFVLALLSGCAGVDAQKTPVSAAAKAPDFSLPDQNGKDVKLSEVLANYCGAVLAFYPKDDSRN